MIENKLLSKSALENFFRNFHAESDDFSGELAAALWKRLEVVERIRCTMKKISIELKEETDRQQRFAREHETKISEIRKTCPHPQEYRARYTGSGCEPDSWDQCQLCGDELE